MNRLFFTLVCIPMESLVLGQTGDKDLKLLALFLAITGGACYEWIESNLTLFQHDNPYLTLGILCKNMFVRHALASFLRIKSLMPFLRP
jgi:hypothetical protein